MTIVFATAGILINFYFNIIPLLVTDKKLFVRPVDSFIFICIQICVFTPLLLSI